MVCRALGLGKVRCNNTHLMIKGDYVQAELFFAIPGDLESRTGGYAYDRRLLQEFAALGLRTTVVPLAASYPYPDAEALADTERRFAQLPDNSIVLVDGLAFGAMPESACKHGQRLQFIALCHHPLALETGLSPQQKETFIQSESVALRCSQAIVVTSPATALTLQSLFAVEAATISIALPGTDPVPFSACSGNPPVLLTAATLTQRKGHDLLIDALSNIAHLPWQARFIGAQHYDPDWSDALKQKVQAAGLSERILFLGAIADLEPEYQQADIFVLPSHYEGYGMVFAEAIAHGLPVVATRCGAAEDLVPSTAGRLVPVGDCAALSAALSELLQDLDLRTQLQQGARDASQQLPCWRSSANIIQQLVQAIAQKERTNP